MPAPPALLDECVDAALVALLRERGFDAVSLLVVGPRRISDRLVLERALELGRVLITQNTADFKALHAGLTRVGASHAGIICLPQRGPLERKAIRAAMMLDWISVQPHHSRLFVWGQLQQQLERGFRLSGFSEAEVRQALGQS